MHASKSSLSLFKVFALLMIVALAISQVNFTATATDGLPPKPDQPLRTLPDEMKGPRLTAVEDYYGPLALRTGPIGVIVELEDTPSALVFAENKGLPQGTLSGMTIDQTRLIEGKQSNLMRSLQAKGIQASEMHRTQRVFNGVWMTVEASDVGKMVELPGIKAIHPIIPLELTHTTSVPLLGAPEVWAGLGEYQGENIKVAIIDTGVDYTHSMFGGTPASTFPTAKVVGGYDFAGDAYNGDNTPVPDSNPMDCNGHGTHVAGSAAGFGVLPDGSTFVESLGDTYADLAALSANDYIDKFKIGPGMAPKADLYALKVFGCGGSTNLTELALEWAMDPDGDGDFSDRMDVINMSLGSNFGSETDPSAVATNNAALAGIVVVASAGNAGDVFYITGSPGIARYAISVASSQDSSTILNAFEVTASSNAALIDVYEAGMASFGPATFDVTGAAALADPIQACDPLTNPGAVAGKIAVVDRGTCNFSIKVYNAQQAGAIGVLVVNNAAGAPFGMAPGDFATDVTIPSMMSSQADGTAIKNELGVPGSVTINLNSATELFLVDPSLEDVASDFTSRGPARGDTRLKPDLSAPGDTIYSALTGTEDGGASFSGTSMAAPHVAGMMALLREIHPTWSVFELKALAMNTATHEVLWESDPTEAHTPTRIGAGRVDAVDAAESQVIAYNQSDPGEVSLSFGLLQVTGMNKVFAKNLVVENKGATDAQYNVFFDERYFNNGIGIDVFDEFGAAIANPITVPAGGQVVLQVIAVIDGPALEFFGDPSVVFDQPFPIAVLRSYFAEGGGYVWLEAVGLYPDLRVPVHLAARPASNMSVAENSLDLGPMDTGFTFLTPSGTPVDTSDDGSLVYILELMHESANEPWSFGPNEAADFKYIGIGSDYPYEDFEDSSVFIGVATHGKWNTPNTVYFEIYFDIDQDGEPDYIAYNLYDRWYNGHRDIFVVEVCPLPYDADLCDNWWYLNGFSGGFWGQNTNHFNSDTMVLPVPVDVIGLEEGVNTAFDFQVVSFAREAAGAVDISPVMTYDLENQSFDTIDYAGYGMPVWDDNFDVNQVFPIGYDKQAIAENNSQGLLLLHMHNANNSAEIVLLPPQVTAVERADTNPTAADMVDFLVTFSRPVSGVDLSDFLLVSTGVSGAAIQDVTCAIDLCTVTVSTGSDNGTLQLNVVDDDSIVDAVTGAPLGGMGTGNGAYSMGQIYTVIKDVTFADVPADYWAWSFIERLYDAGITAGCSVNPLVYCPEENATRGQMAVFLLRGIEGAGYNPPAATGTVFSDVPTTHVFAAWIEELADRGIAGGYADGTYRPDNTVSRAEMAILLLRAKHGPGYVPPAATGTAFSDVPADFWAAAWIEQLVNEGIASGFPDGTYRPSDPVTRAQMAVLLVRTFELP